MRSFRAGPVAKPKALWHWPEAPLFFHSTEAGWPWGSQMAAQGLTTIRSSYEPKDTMDRLEAGVKAKGMTVFARIDHAAGGERRRAVAAAD
jgi:hypothetical protein